jgi:protein involved in polysaccharide export with SLBB domain
MVRFAQRGRLGSFILIAGLLAACSSPDRPVAPPAVSATPTNAVAPPADGSAASVAGYRLGPGDQVRLTVFRHEDLSGEFEMDGEGFFSMPLVGEVQGGGLTARELENEIELRLKSGGYLVNPQVSIEVLNYRPFYIIGEVSNPGSYQYVNGMTVINAVALAGGFTYRAAQGSVEISRGGSNGPKLEAQADTPVLPGDIIEVPERFF